MGWKSTCTKCGKVKRNESLDNLSESHCDSCYSLKLGLNKIEYETTKKGEKRYEGFIIEHRRKVK